VLTYQGREKAAEAIVDLANEHSAITIVIGQALDWDGEVSYQGRKAKRLAGTVRSRTSLPVVLWNEYGSTQAARDARIQMGVSREKRSGHLDDIAATVILQNYLDAQNREDQT
jgi:putative Holliday junction resolvase